MLLTAVAAFYNRVRLNFECVETKKQIQKRL